MFQKFEFYDKLTLVDFYFMGDGEQRGLGEFAYIDVDINYPSISFAIDDKGVVNEVVLLNDNDDFEIKDMNLEGKDFVNAFEMVVQKLRDEGYFEEKTSVFMFAALNVENSIANEERLVGQLMSARYVLNKFGENIGTKGIIVDKSIREKASEYNVSMGR